MSAPLNLAAIEARLNDPSKTGNSLADCWALLAHARALRHITVRLRHHIVGLEPGHVCRCVEDAAAVLAAAQDGPA